MQIEIIAVSVEDKGKYKMAEVTYKSDGKTSTKKLMSFGAGADVFKVLSTAQPKATFDIKSQKNDKGFWDWVGFGTGAAPASTSSSSSPATPSPRSTYETAEERAQRQVMIVRQSSISNAVAFYALNSKKAPAYTEILEVAKQFENYVFGRETAAYTADNIHEIESDIPY